MNINTIINKAKQNKNDEFYTRYEDIEEELSYYPVEQFENKIIYCPCDDPDWSNFTKYFINNFERLKLKKLISTCIALNKPSVFQIINGDYEENQLKGKYLIKNKNIAIKGYLNTDGDFRNKECLRYLKEADIIITNPPFSLFREFISLMIKYKKLFLVIGNQNAITYKEVFPYIKENKFIVNFVDLAFCVPENTMQQKTRFWIDENGQKWKSRGDIIWLSNIKISKHTNQLKFTQLYDSQKFKKFENYDAINVSKISDIPIDYNGIMAVPITYLKYHDENRFEIVGEANHGLDNEFDLFKPILNGKEIFKRILIRRIS